MSKLLIKQVGKQINKHENKNSPTEAEGFDELCLFNFIIPSKKGRVTIAAHKLSDDVNLKTEKSILQQAGLI